MVPVLVMFKLQIEDASGQVDVIQWIDEGSNEQANVFLKFNIFTFWGISVFILNFI
jgi:hypothetical protein